MPGSQNPVTVKDYHVENLQSTYAYYASVLQPGMSQQAMRNAMTTLRDSTGGPFNQEFVAKLDNAQIDYFINNYEIMSSSAVSSAAQQSGLDALILRSKTSNNIIISVAGVGPFNYDLPDATSFDNETAKYGLPISEIIALKDMALPILNTYSQDAISFNGHSKGGPIAAGTYALLSIMGYGNRINGVVQFAPAGMTTVFHTSDFFEAIHLGFYGAQIDSDMFALAGDIVDWLEVNNGDRMIDFTAENDRVTGKNSLFNNPLMPKKVYGTHVELKNPNGSFRYAHNIGTIGDLMLNGPLKDMIIPNLSPLITGSDRIDDVNDIIVTAPKSRKVALPHRAPQRVKDPNTGILLPSGMVPVSGGEPGGPVYGYEQATRRFAEFEIEEVNGQEIITKQTIFDSIDIITNKPKVAVVQQLDSAGRVISSDIKISGNPVGIEFSEFGSVLGSTLGYRLAGGDELAGIVYSAALKTLGDNLGDVLDGIVGRQSETHAVKDAFSATGSEFLSNLKSAGIGAISSFLTAELVNAIGIDGFAGQLANTAASAAIGQIATNLTNLGKTFVENGINKTTGAFSHIDVTLVGNAVGSFVGSYLASKVISFDTVGGQIGAAVGSALASGAMGLAISAAVEAGTTTGLAGTFASLGAIGGPVGVAVAAFVGFILGGLIGSLFGGTPRSGADSVWDAEKQQFVVANVWSRKGGSKDAARSVASAVSETFNGVLAATGGVLMNPQAVRSGNYGMRKSAFVYREQGEITQSFTGKDAATRLIGYGVYTGLTDPDFQIAGGDIYVKRALYNTFAPRATGGNGLDPRNFDASVLMGNIASAQQYESYLANSTVISALVSAEPDSVFAIETLLTLARADELGLTRRAASDWVGGFSFLMKEAQTSAGNVEFGFDYDPASGQISRLIGVGDYVMGDAIDIAGQTTIEGSGSAVANDNETLPSARRAA